MPVQGSSGLLYSPSWKQEYIYYQLYLLIYCRVEVIRELNSSLESWGYDKVINVPYESIIERLLCLNSSQLYQHIIILGRPHHYSLYWSNNSKVFPFILWSYLYCQFSQESGKFQVRSENYTLYKLLKNTVGILWFL